MKGTAVLAMISHHNCKRVVKHKEERKKLKQELEAAKAQVKTSENILKTKRNDIHLDALMDVIKKDVLEGELAFVLAKNFPFCSIRTVMQVQI